jgi:hypothetical protein
MAADHKGQAAPISVFISYSSKDADWVREWLLPQLEDAGIKVHIDFRDFEIGTPSLINIEHAIENNQKTLLVLTPNWVQSEWANFEALLLQTQNPSGRARRMLPLMLEDCELPPRLAIFTWADFRHHENWETELERLLGQISQEQAKPAIALKEALPGQAALHPPRPLWPRAGATGAGRGLGGRHHQPPLLRGLGRRGQDRTGEQVALAHADGWLPRRAPRLWLVLLQPRGAGGCPGIR